jgi:hypothetical protein
MKRMNTIMLACLTAGILSSGGVAFANTDYSGYTISELAAVKGKGTLQNASEQERMEFQKAWKKRLAELTPEQRQQYLTTAGSSRDPASGEQPNCQ